MEPQTVEQGDEAGLEGGALPSSARAGEPPGGSSGRLTPAHAAAAAAVVGSTVALQTAAFRLSGLATPLVLLLASLLTVALVHAALVVGLGGRGGERPWCASLALLPPLLAVAPALDRLGGSFGLGLVGLALAAAGAVVALTLRWPLVPARPLSSALLGGVAGVALAAVCHSGQLEAPRVALGRGALFLLAASGLAALIGLAWSLPEGASPLPPFRVSLALAGTGLLIAAAFCRSVDRPLPPPAGASAGPGAAGTASGRFGGGAKPPIVLIVLDSVRADHLAAYGYGRDTMPALERFARSHAVRIERAITNSPSSLESHASLFTGLLPSRHGAHRPTLHGPSPAESPEPLRPEIPTLAALLQSSGYWTVGLAANYGSIGPASGLGRGFAAYRAAPGWRQRPALLDPYRFALARRWPLAPLDRLPPFGASDFFSLSTPYRRGAEIVAAAAEALDRAGERPFFLFVNLMDAHAPYRPPRTAGLPYSKARRPGWRALADDQRATDEVMAGKRKAEERELAAWIDGYDVSLRALDAALAPLLSRLARHPRFAEMTVVVTSDHGEGFGEHGLYRHSTALYGEMLRVPLFLKPGARRPAGFEPGSSLPGPFQTVDLFPTLLEQAGQRAPKSIDGLLWGRGRESSVAEAYAHAPSVKLGERFRRDQRAIEAGGWKLIAASDGSVELYNLIRDPLESQNLSTEMPEKARIFGEMLRHALDKPNTPVPTLGRVEHDGSPGDRRRGERP